MTCRFLARIQLGRTAGQVERIERQSVEGGDDTFDGSAVHDLVPIGSGGDVAMQALLVAAIAKIDLQRRRGPTNDRRKRGRDQLVQGIEHMLIISVDRCEGERRVYAPAGWSRGMVR